MNTTELKLANLKRDLESIVTNYNEYPTRANYNRIRAMRREIEETARG